MNEYTSIPFRIVPEYNLPADISLPDLGSMTILVITNATSPSLLQLVKSCPNLLSGSPFHILGMRYFCASRGLGRCFTAMSRTTSCSCAFSHIHFFLFSPSISYIL